LFTAAGAASGSSSSTTVPLRVPSVSTMLTRGVGMLTFTEPSSRRVWAFRMVGTSSPKALTTQVHCTVSSLVPATRVTSTQPPSTVISTALPRPRPDTVTVIVWP
jgi:hypothetical protein